MPHRALTIDSSASSSSVIEEEIIQCLRKQATDTPTFLPLYDDPDFPADVSSLYFHPDKPPDYALSSAHVEWYRPTEYARDPAYFKSSLGCGVLREGSLQDAWLLGVFAAVALHPDNLIENLFVSESLEHFKQFGVFTCRFFKDHQWISVTTDTRIPCSLAFKSNDKSLKSSTPRGSVLYGTSTDENEVFIPLLEKAYAKVHGNYQVLDEKYGGGVGGSAGTSSGRILEAFLDCTGGSAHRVELQVERGSYDQGAQAERAANVASSPSLLLWNQLVRYKRQKCIVTIQVRHFSLNAQEVTTTGIVKNRQYVVQHVTEVDRASSRAADTAAPSVSRDVLRFVKLQTVWGRGMWQGDWSNDDSKWDEHAHVEHALRRDPRCNFSRSGSDGCFWMVWEDVIDTFTELFVVHIFPPDVHQYSVRGDWVGLSAAGAPLRVPVFTERATAETSPSYDSRRPIRINETAIEKSRWTWLQDADPNWHRNPQYKLSVPLDRQQEGRKGDTATQSVLLSLTQRDFRLYGGDNYAINFVVLRTKETSDPPSAVWEFKRSHVVAEAHSYACETSVGRSGWRGTPTVGNGNKGVGLSSTKSIPERELVIEGVCLSAHDVYSLVPYTTNSKVEMEFFLRVVASHPVRLEQVPPLHSVVCTGRWRAGDSSEDDPRPSLSSAISSAGGPLLPLPWPPSHVSGKENPAWCQNPQFWVRFADQSPRAIEILQNLLATKAYVTIKLVLRKTSRCKSVAKARQRDGVRDRAQMVGLTAVRVTPVVPIGSVRVGGTGTSAATQLRARNQSPKTTFLGEPRAETGVHGTTARHNQKTKRVPLDESSDDEADRSSLRGPFPTPKLVVSPTEWCRLSSYASPTVACLYLQKVPKEWLFASDSANAVGGLLVVPTLGEAGAEGAFELQIDSDCPLLVEELPRGVQSIPGEWTAAKSGGCHLHSKWMENPKFYLQIQSLRPTKARITLTRSEREWKARCQQDPVGTMIGFYVFPKGADKSGRLEDPSGLGSTSNSIKINGRAWRETAFVPLHSVTLLPDLVLATTASKSYVIMPATYEPGKVGKFVLSVQCDTEFTLCGDPE